MSDFGDCFRFFTEIASDCETLDAGNHNLSFINDANVLALHRLLWNNQEKIGDYLSSSRWFSNVLLYFIFFVCFCCMGKGLSSQCLIFVSFL